MLLIALRIAKHHELMSNARTAEQKRDTAETKVEVKIDIDGCGQSKINTGVAFFDHMLTLFSKHFTSINFIFFVIFLQRYILAESSRLLFFLKGFFLVIAQNIFLSLSFFAAIFEIAK